MVLSIAANMSCGEVNGIVLHGYRSIKADLRPNFLLNQKKFVALRRNGYEIAWPTGTVDRPFWMSKQRLNSLL